MVSMIHVIHEGTPLTVESAHPRTAMVNWPRSQYKNLAKLCSVSTDLHKAQQELTRRFTKYFLPASLVLANSSPRRLPPAAGSPRSLWWPLGFHPAWRHAQLQATLNAFCKDEAWAQLLEEAFGAPLPLEIRVAWRNQLPYAVHRLQRVPSSAA